MTSNALFMRVAESTVIFRPISHVGCLSACSGVTDDSRSREVSLNAPPDAVIISLDTVARSPLIHCQIALGSLSRGMRSTPSEFASEVTISPAITMVSLLARAICLRAEIAARVGAMATCPVVAVTTTSTSSWQTSSVRSHSLMPFVSKRDFSSSAPLQWIYLGRNSSICLPSNSRLRLQASATTSNISGNVRTTSRVWVPTEPVEPSIASPFLPSSMIINHTQRRCLIQRLRRMSHGLRNII